jgi:hypothetical protein
MVRKEAPKIRLHQEVYREIAAAAKKFDTTIVQMTEEAIYRHLRGLKGKPKQSAYSLPRSPKEAELVRRLLALVRVPKDPAAQGLISFLRTVPGGRKQN